jgi:uncharacterized membrane protein YhaH (DUF805 family)
MQWMIMPLKRYAQFSGRSRRMEFWMWIVFVILAVIVLSIVDTALGLGGSSRMGTGVPAGATSGVGAYANANGGILTGLFSLAILIPNIAVQVRRLHDIGRSGWWIGGFYLFYVVFLVSFFALGVSALGGVARGGAAPNLAAFGVFLGVGGLAFLIYAIVLLVFFFLPGTTGPNRYGPDPKNPEANLGEVFS